VNADPRPSSPEEVENRQLHRLLDHLPALLAYWDRDLRNVVANQAYVEWFGVSPAQMRGMHIREVLGEDVYAKNLPFIRGALAGEEQLFERTLVDPTGRVRHSQASYVPDVVDGEVVGFFVLVTDVTPRVEAQRELAAAQGLARAGSWVYYPATGETSWSTEMYRLLGYDPSAAPGESGWVRPSPEALLARVHPDDAARVTEMREQIGALGEGYEAAYRLLLPDGDVRHVRSRGKVERDAAGVVLRLTGTTQDETELRRAADDLARANQQLGQANEALADTIAMLGHDVRQPLQGVLGFLQVALAQWDGAAVDTRDLVTRAERSARRMNALVHDILTLVNLDTGTLTTRPARARTSDLGRAAVDAVGPDGGVELDLRADAEVEVDRFQMGQALTNLLTNALRYGQPPVVLTVDADAGGARLAVSDRGEGVPEEFVDQLFQRFSRATSGVAADVLGTGFGLYLARRLVEANGGRLDYAPAAGGGACFTITLPTG
jgi:PAS domain S-box-containing protein